MPHKPKIILALPTGFNPRSVQDTKQADPLVKIRICAGRTRVMRRSQYDRMKAAGDVRAQLVDTSVRTYFKKWRSVTLEHINVEGENPLTFHREQDLRDYCKKHKLESGALPYS